MLWERSGAICGSGGGRLPRHSPLGGGRAPYEGAQQPQDLELGAFSPHSHDMPASPALSLCLRQPPGPSNVRERAAGGTLLVDRSRRALGAAACAPARPPRRSRGRRGELSKSSLGVYCCNGRRGLAVQCVTGPGRPRLGVQRPGPGQAVAHGYGETCRCAGSAVWQAWCLARVAFQRFQKKSVNIACNGCEDVTDSGSFASHAPSKLPPVCLIPFLRSGGTKSKSPYPSLPLYESNGRYYDVKCTTAIIRYV